MKRWIIAVSAAVVAAVLGMLTLPGAVGSTLAAWNTTATAGATATAGTWGPTAPADPAPASSGISNGNAPTVISAITWNSSAGVNFCVTVTASTTSATAVPWSIRIDTDATPFNGKAPSDVPWWVSMTARDVNGVVILTGVSGHATITASSPLSFDICQYSGNAPAIVAAGPTTYSFSSVLEPGANANYACVQTTVTGYAPYHVGFEVMIDWRQVLQSSMATSSPTYQALITKQLTGWHGSGGSYEYTRNGYVYTGHGTGYGTTGVKAGAPVVLHSCTS